MPGIVNVVLDLREADRIPETADDFLSLWTEIEDRLRGTCLQAAPGWRVETANWGTCGLLLAEPEAAPAQVADDTPFAVRAVLEPSRIGYKCQTCARRGRETYGPFICERCPSEGQQNRVCDHHAIILDGSFRATCPQHPPICPCDATATFWCRGRGCRAAKAYCDRHRCYHPGDRATSYCPACYTAQFPACGHPGCDATGSLACEYVSPDSMSQCRARICTLHAFRWQVFGPHRRGLVLCLDHWRRLRRLSHGDLTFQIVASSCSRDNTPGKRRNGAREYGNSRLPRLSVVRHIFINTLGEALDMRALNALFTELQDRLDNTGLQGRMRRRLEQQEKIRAQDTQTFLTDLGKGYDHFARLQRHLTAQGQRDLASRVSFSDFRQKSNILWVRVPPDLTRSFKGRHGANIKALSDALGLTVMVESK